MAEQSTQIHWIEVRIKTSGELAEPLAEVLGRFVSNGVVIESVTQYNPIAHEEEPTGDVVVFGYLPADDRLEEQRQKLNEALWYLGRIAEIPEPVFSPIHDENWMSAWKVHYQPIRVGATFLILPAWMEPDPNEQRRIIRINPAMAFGTGTHPTTQLILELLEKKNYVERRKISKDKREQIIFITDEGRQLFEQASPYVKKVEDTVDSILDEGEMLTLIRLLEKLLKSLPFTK